MHSNRKIGDKPVEMGLVKMDAGKLTRAEVEKQRELPIENYGRKEQKEWLENICNLTLTHVQQGTRRKSTHSLTPRNITVTCL